MINTTKRPATAFIDVTCDVMPRVVRTAVFGIEKREQQDVHFIHQQKSIWAEKTASWEIEEILLRLSMRRIFVFVASLAWPHLVIIVKSS